MAVQVDEGGGRVLRRHIESLGVRVHTGKSTTGIEAGTEHQHVLRFADGESTVGCFNRKPARQQQRNAGAEHLTRSWFPTRVGFHPL